MPSLETLQAELLTTEAKAFAQSHGLIDSLVLVRALIEQAAPPAIPIKICLAADPEIAAYQTLVFEIPFGGSTGKFLELHDRVLDLIFDRVPAEHRRYLSFGLE